MELICSNGSGCAELEHTAAGVLIRSNQRPDETRHLDPGEWADLVAAIKAGELDHTLG